MSRKIKDREMIRLTDAVRKYGEKRKARVLRLRRQGFTWQAIGDQLGVSHQRAQQIGKAE